MATKVIIGCNEIRDYQFLAPLTGLVWREVIGFEPYFFIAGDWQANRRGQEARQALADHDFFALHVGQCGRFGTPTIAQNVREHAAMMPLFGDDEWLMPSDVDLWPIRKAFYQQHVASVGKAVCYYANGDHYQTFPTCHVTMRAATWREVYGYKVNPLGLEDQIARTIEEWLPTRKFWRQDEGFAIWMSDQAIVTDKLRAMPWFAAASVMVERPGHPPVDRLDRSSWPKDGIGDLVKWTDAHLPRPSDQPENWYKVFELFKAMLPQHADWAAKYREKYLAGY